MFLFFLSLQQGNLKDEIKHLQEAEQEVKNNAADLTQKKETFSVRYLVVKLSLNHVCFLKLGSDNRSLTILT